MFYLMHLFKRDAVFIPFLVAMGVLAWWDRGRLHVGLLLVFYVVLLIALYCHRRRKRREHGG